jgi:hypothetical protein
VVQGLRGHLTGVIHAHEGRGFAPGLSRKGSVRLLDIPPGTRGARRDGPAGSRRRKQGPQGAIRR